MKRLLALCLAAGLCLLAGCGTSGGGSSEASGSGGIFSGGTLDTSAVTEMMDALTAYQPGTAGSSLKAYIAACGILNYAEGYDTADEEALRQGVSDWLDAAAPETLEMVREGFPAVTAAAEGVLAGDAESLALLADAGSPNRYDSYNPGKYEAVKTILAELLEPADPPEQLPE